MLSNLAFWGCVCVSKQKGLSLYNGTAGSWQCWFGNPEGCLHQTPTPTHRQTPGGRPSSEEGVLFYQHKSHQVIRLSTVTVETGGNGNRWWNRASIRKSHNTQIPYARMQEHRLSIKHNTHTHKRKQRDAIRKSAANQNNLTGMMTGLSVEQSAATAITRAPWSLHTFILCTVILKHLSVFKSCSVRHVYLSVVSNTASM